MMLNIFHMSAGHLYVLFGEVSIQILCTLYNWLVSFFSDVDFCKFFVNFEYSPLIRSIGKYVVPYCGLSSYFVDVLSFAVQKRFSLM